MPHWIHVYSWTPAYPFPIPLRLRKRLFLKSRDGNPSHERGLRLDLPQKPDLQAFDFTEMKHEKRKKNCKFAICLNYTLSKATILHKQQF